MTKKRDRFFALFGAVLFLVTASALSVAVVWSAIASKDEKPTASQDAETPVKTGDQLAGKPLADFTPVASIGKLESIDTLEGSGDVVKKGASVTVDYTGAVAATGTVFQSSLDSGQPVTFSLDGVIKGWTDGIPGMKVGGVRRLLIPAAQAYGANPPAGSGIPANADLVFDVTLHSISK